MDEKNKVNDQDNTFKLIRNKNFFKWETSKNITIYASKDDVEQAKKDIRNEIIQERWTLIWVFWIFASIVTFLSIEIQVLRSICDYNIFVWITLIILWWLILFNVIMNYLIRNNIDPNKKEIILFISSILLIWTWIIIWLFGDEDSCRDKKYIEYESKIEQRIDDIEKKYYKQTKQYIITKPSGH